MHDKSRVSRERPHTPTFEELMKPLPAASLKYWRYRLIEGLLRSVGRLSEGIRLGYRHGFDSGMLMNHAYRNEPSGRFVIGRMIDRTFLNQATCRAFRAIKMIQKEAIKKFIRERAGRETFIADLASGKADYVYDALVELGAEAAGVRVLLRDISEETLRESRAIGEKLGLSGRVRYERADAMDAEALRRISPKPDLVIEAGLYGIIHEDERIRGHLRDLREIVSPGAVLFNVQSYNPQIELIARVLVNARGGRCVWRLRPAEAVVQWAEDAGFRDAEITEDPFGIYSVVLMRG